MSLTATGYFNYLWRDVVRAYTSPLQSQSRESVTAVDTRADGRIYGGEFFFRHRPYKNLFASVAYSLSRSERHERAEWVIAAVDQTHTLSMLASYVLPFGWHGVWYEIGYEPIYSDQRRTARLPMYHQLDVRFDRTWTYDTWKLTLYLDVMNAYFSPLTVSAHYSFDYSKPTPLQVTFPFLPMLGVQGEF